MNLKKETIAKLNMNDLNVVKGGTLQSVYASDGKCCLQLPSIEALCIDQTV